MFAFPEEASWNDAEQSVEFAVELGPYRGKVFVPLRVFHALLGRNPTPEQCIACFHLSRTNFERAAEARLHARALDEDANIRLTGRDLRQSSGIRT